MPDDVPSMDVSEQTWSTEQTWGTEQTWNAEQTWSDSATNVPEGVEEASEDSSLNETYQEMPSPTTTKADLPGLPEPPHHLSKHVLSMYSAASAPSPSCYSGQHSETASPHL